jgi:NAD(P)-dependent dehydrogenase (short-subunit alcohol dehydrogenase family)
VGGQGLRHARLDGGDRLDQLAQQIRDQGGRAISRATDVTRGVDLRRLVDSAVAEYGRLDVLVSNAGISKIGPWPTSTSTAGRR